MWWRKLGLLVSRISSLYDRLTIHPNYESTWLSINIGFGRVHQWVGNGPITVNYSYSMGISDMIESKKIRKIQKTVTINIECTQFSNFSTLNKTEGITSR